LGVDHALSTETQHSLRPGHVPRPSHLAKSEAMSSHRSELFKLTGIAHQPLQHSLPTGGTKRRRPDPLSTRDWYLMPDLLGFLLTGVRRHEQTQSSTTQLMAWTEPGAKKAFDLVGWPMPSLLPPTCGGVIGHCDQGAHRVCRKSRIQGLRCSVSVSWVKTTLILNVGTWALLGVMTDAPCVTPVAESGRLDERMGP